MKICSVEGCEEKHESKGYCIKHYRRFQKHGDPLKIKAMKVCSVEGCEVVYFSKGYCITHYGRWKTHGDPSTVETNRKYEGCSIEGCGGKHKGRSYCGKHFLRFKKFGDPLYINDKYNHDDKCKIEGCEGDYDTKGYCAKHYMRFLIHGDAMKSLMNREEENCSVEDCKGKYYQHRLCKKHFSNSELGRSRAKLYFHKRRSLKRNSVINDFTEKDWRKSLKHFNNGCAYCGSTDKKIHQEHVIPISKGGSNTITNIIPACETCNTSKGAKLIETWYPKQKFYSKQRETKIYKWMGYTVNQDTIQATLF